MDMNENKIQDDRGRLQSFESFGLLAGGLAHDYNNMLTAMLGNVDLILCEDIPDSVRETATDIKAMMLKAATLVRRMLSYASRSEPQDERIDFNVLVRDIVRIMKRAIPDNAVVNIAPAVGVPYVMADTAMFWQVVMNLVVNACDALEGKEGIVTVSVGAGSYDAADLASYYGARPLPGGDYVEIDVTDTGCGMDAETRQRIFEPLFTTKAKGNGLGLASVMTILNAYSGGVKVESEKGKGTTFRVVVPAYHAEDGSLVYPDDAPPKAPQPASAAAAKPVPQPVREAASAKAAEPAGVPVFKAGVSSSPVAAASAQPGEKRTVLVVDDDPSIVRLLKIILEKSGRYSVITASSGDQGLEVYHRESAVVSLCLVDASMGAGMNGLDLCAAIRAESPTIPLVLMSAYRAKEMSARMATSGITTFLAKPFRGGDVIELCAKYVGGHGA